MTDEKKNTRIPSEEASPTSKPPVLNKDAKADVDSSVTSDEVVEQDVTTRSQRYAKSEKRKDSVVTEDRSQKTEENLEVKKADDSKPVRWVQIRILPIYVRVLLVVILIALAIIGGAYIGYSILGDGAGSDIFKKGTWTHIVDIINGKEQ